MKKLGPVTLPADYPSDYHRRLTVALLKAFADERQQLNELIAFAQSDALERPLSLVAQGYAQKLWSYRMAGTEPVYSSPIGPITVLNGATPTAAVVFSSWDWYVYALKVADGSLIWRKALSAPLYGRCQAADASGAGSVQIFAPGQGAITAIPANGGASTWTFTDLYTREGSGTTTAATATTVTDGTKTWAANAFLRVEGVGYGASLRFTSGPAAGQSREITVSPGGSTLTVASAYAPAPTLGGGDTYVIDKKYSSDNTFQHAGTLVNESGTYYLYAAGFDNHAYKINASTGALVWKFATLENIEPYPLVITVAGNLRCIVGSIDGKVYSLNASTGAQVWSAATGAVDAFLWAGDTDGDGDLEVIVSGRNGRVMILDAAAGTIQYQSTAAQSWSFPEINCASVPVLLAGETTPRIVTGGDAGTAWCFNNNAETKWQRPVAPYTINSSAVIHDVRGDGNLCMLIGDMRGTLHCLEIATGNYLGAIYLKGGIEGVPLYADIDGDGRAELVITTTDGYVEAYRLLFGSVNATTYKPGATMWAGYQT